MSFTPPFFPKFGRTTQDLLTQKLDERKDGKHQLSIVSQSKNVTLTQKLNSSGSDLGKLEAGLTAEYKDKSYGESSLELTTGGVILGKTKLSKLAPGLIVNIEDKYTVKDGSFGWADAKIAAEYKIDGFASTLEYSKARHALLTSAAIGYEGFSIGGLVTTDIAGLQNGNQAFAVDAGLQYEDKNLVGTVTIESNSTISASIYHNLQKNTQLGFKATTTATKGQSIQFAAQHILSPETTLKGRISVFDDKNFTLGAHVQHRKANPNVTVGISHWYNAATATPSFGINVEFGKN